MRFPFLYEAVLADLERRRVELDGAISFIRNQILKQPPQGGLTPPTGAPKPPAGNNILASPAGRGDD